MTKNANLKTDILENGWRILVEKGRDALRLRDLAKENGCSVGTIYNLFENLDEIVLHLNLKCLDKMYSTLHQELTKEIQSQATLHEVLHKLGKTYIRFGLENPWMWKSLFENLAIDPLPAWYRDKVQAGIQFIEKAIQKAYGLQAEKASRIVSFFWAAMHGMTSIMLNKKMEVVIEAVQEESVASYIDHCLKGFLI